MSATPYFTQSGGNIKNIMDFLLRKSYMIYFRGSMQEERKPMVIKKAIHGYIRRINFVKMLPNSVPVYFDEIILRVLIFPKFCQ